MEKYDFGDKISAGSTMEWAAKNIVSRSTILEMGPAVGTLTRFLKEEKECEVDIIEIDTESGVKAAQFARMACVGDEEGNLEEKIWYEKLAGNKYDYIIALDVLEHLRNPEEILRQAVNLLTDNGKALVSIPNIAHNSVIINLINNKFEYTSLGLLDNTHTHFFSYTSACRLLEDCGLYIVSKEGIQLRVGETEIANKYEDICINISKYLRLRKMADVYQFLFIAQRSKIENVVEFSPTNLDYTLYKLEVFAAGAVINSFFVNPTDIEVEIGLPKLNCDELRIDPLEVNCLLAEIDIKGITYTGETMDLKILKTNGIVYKEQSLLFLDNDSQIYININTEIEKILFKAKALLFDDKWINELGEVLNKKTEYEQFISKVVAEKDKISAEKEQIKLEKEQIKLEKEQVILEKEQIILDKDQIIASLKEELNKQKNSMLEQTLVLNNTEEQLSIVSKELKIISDTCWYKLNTKFNQIKKRFKQKKEV